MTARTSTTAPTEEEIIEAGREKLARLRAELPRAEKAAKAEEHAHAEAARERGRGRLATFGARAEATLQATVTGVARAACATDEPRIDATGIADLRAIVSSPVRRALLAAVDQIPDAAFVAKRGGAARQHERHVRQVVNEIDTAAKPTGREQRAQASGASAFAPPFPWELRERALLLELGRDALAREGGQR